MHSLIIKLFGVDFEKVAFEHIKQRIEKEFAEDKDMAVQITPTEADNVHKLYEMAFEKFKKEHPDKIASLIAERIDEFSELCRLEGKNYTVEKFELEAFDSYLLELSRREHSSKRFRLLLGLLHLAKKYDRRIIALEPEKKGLPGGVILNKKGGISANIFVSDSDFGKNLEQIKKEHIIGKLHNIAKDPLTKSKLFVLLEEKTAIEIAKELKKLGWASLEP